MPLYEYQCDACGRRFEAIRKFSDPDPAACTLCGSGPVRRLLSSPAIQFKGTGWYITDYAQKGKSSGDGTSGDGATADKKPASTAETSAKADAPASPAKTATTES